MLPLTVREPASTTTSIKLRTVHLVLAAPMCELRVCQGSKRTGWYMQSFAGSGPFIECLGRIILWCAERGEALVLLGCEEDWRAQRTFLVPLWPKANPREPSRGG